MELYTLAIGHVDYPVAEIFHSRRAVLERRLEFSEVDDAQRDRLLELFDCGDSHAYERALNELESLASIVCTIEAHEL